MFSSFRVLAAFSSGNRRRKVWGHNGQQPRAGDFRLAAPPAAADAVTRKCRERRREEPICKAGELLVVERHVENRSLGSFLLEQLNN